MTLLRWGIVSAGKISHDFVSALSTLPASDHQAVAVAARDLKRAQEFAKLHGISKSYDNYKAIAEDKDIDVVYIGCLNPQHYEVAKLMLENGKPVLCEKPLTLNLKQTSALVSLAREKKIFLMEAVWSRAFPAYKELKNQIQQGVIGDVKQVVAGFGFQLTGVDRIMKKEMGGGTVLDLGVYTLQFQQYLFGKRKPLSIQASGHLSDYGTDVSMAAVLKYDDGLALVHTSGNCLLPNEATVIGTKGIIRIPSFWCPTKLILPTETKEFPLPETKLTFNFINSVGLRYEAEEVRQCLQKGLTENPSITLDETLQLAELMDTIRKQIGVVYPQDNE